MGELQAQDAMVLIGGHVGVIAVDGRLRSDGGVSIPSICRC